MSTFTQAAPSAPAPAPATSRPRLVGRPLALTFLAEFASLTSFLLLVSVLPMLAAADGADSAAAGLITGALLGGTVIAEAAATVAIRRFGYRAALAAGALLLGAPTLALLPREPLAIMLAVSFVRGLGFGLCGVAAGGLTALLLPPERRGEGLGLLGIVSGVPAIVALPAGVWLAGHHQATVVVAVAAVAGLAPLAALRWLPGGRPRPRAGNGPVPGGGAIRLALIFAVCTVAAGVIDSFLPLARELPGGVASAALLVEAITATISRWQAGRHGDRYGHARLLIPAVVASAAGLAAMIWLASPAAVLAGMALFGAGFGVIENSTFALLIERLPEDRASALWNLAYDAGYGIGPVVFGLFSAHVGYPAGFALTGVVVLAALPAALRERRERALPQSLPDPGRGRAGALAHDQPGLQLHAQRLVSVPVELAHQHRHGGPAHLLQRLADGGEARGGGPADVDVVEAGDRHVLGHPQPARHRHLHHPDRDLVVEADHGGRPRPQIEQLAAGPHPGLGGWLTRPHQLRVAQDPGFAQRGQVPAEPVVPGVPVRRPGDHPDPAVAELDQMPGDGPGAGEVRRRDRHHASRHVGPRVHHHQRVPPREERLEVGPGLRGEDQDRAVHGPAARQLAQRGRPDHRVPGVEEHALLVQRQRLGDRRDDVPEVVGQQVGTAHEDGRPGCPGRRPAARLRRPVAEPFDHRRHPLAGLRGHVLAAIEHSGDGGYRQPGFGRDRPHRYPAGLGL